MRSPENRNNNYINNSEPVDKRGKYDAAEFARQNGQRQQRKIIASFLRSKNGKPDISVLNQKDVDLRQGDREEFLNRIRNSYIQLSDEKSFLSSIESPVDKYGVEGVGRGLTKMHELRILGHMSAGPKGFKKWYDLNLDNLRTFLERYPLPSDFELESTWFLNVIEERNGKQKRDEYEQAMRDFKRKIYGKRYEYWEQLKQLNSEAEAPKRSAEQNLRSPIRESRHGLRDENGFKPKSQYEYGPAEFSKIKKRGRMARSSGEKKQTDEQNDENLSQRMESVANFEWVSGTGASTQVSKDEVDKGKIDQAKLLKSSISDESCQDSLVLQPEKGLYGVFDGVGGQKNGRLASQTAAKTLEGISKKVKFGQGRHLAQALNQVNRAVYDKAGGGYTTAAIAQVVEGLGGKYLAWASVGDSRIYIVDRSGHARQITEDEGFENRVSNILGKDRNDDHVRQFGEIKIRPGDRVVVCSDGITGDFRKDLMSENTIGWIVSSSRTPKEASIALVNAASKKDDRTAVVFAP